MDENHAHRDEPLAKSGRRWYQYALRTLLVFVTFTGHGLGRLGWMIYQARHQQSTVYGIQKLGGAVFFDYEYSEEGVYKFNAKPPGPKWLHAILGDDFFRSVNGINFVSTSLQDADLDCIKGLTTLKWLKLDDDPSVTDAGLKRLEELSQLEMLHLDRTQTSDSGLEFVKRFANLKELSLGGTQVTDEGLKGLKQLPHLKVLNLRATHVTDAGLENLKVLVQLERLSLDYLQVSDAGLLQLRGLTQLKELALTNALVTDASVESLKRFTNLESLDLTGTQLTDVAVENLRQALPNCRITR